MALNSNCGSVGGCNAGSAQYRWLQSELLQNKQKCTVAYMHHPFLSSGQNGSTPALLPLMRLLYENNVDLVLAGPRSSLRAVPSDHPGTVPDPAKGLRLFTVGTGGRDLYTFPQVLPNSAVRNNQNFGVLTHHHEGRGLRLVLRQHRGIVIDSGSGVCF